MAQERERLQQVGTARGQELAGKERELEAAAGELARSQAQLVRREQELRRAEEIAAAARMNIVDSLRAA